jgi:hypothetical protein
MREYIRRPAFVRSVEFWTATSIFIVAVFFRITAALTGDASGLPVTDASQVGRIPENYYSLYFFPQLLQYAVLYAAFLLLHFVIVPRLVNRQALVINILLALITISLLGLGLGVLDTYLKHTLLLSYPSQAEAHFAIIRERMLYSVWMSLLFGFYTAARYGEVYVLGHFDYFQRKYPFLTFGGLLAFILWTVSMFFIAALTEDRYLIAGWAVFPPSLILYYWYSFYYLIPKALKRKKPFRYYLLSAFVIMFVAFLPVSLFALALSGDSRFAFPAGVMNSLFQVMASTPFLWLWYMRRLKGSEELQSLREQLGQSTASIDFLRSQINPHFLFNALNTIYGTAIQEKAERTSEGVQRLGDMMRFMLQENMQEQIALVREIEYLNNYISLQRLRTDAQPGIVINVDIEDAVHTAQIAPMLLIPFVENAFKHGISLRDRSYIKIGLELRGDLLNFDVHNSRHERPDGDPERHKSGIGLSNVRQRLELIYPGRHELIIRETGKEFFVHLTIQLS